jgi:hypothetical protein
VAAFRGAGTNVYFDQLKQALFTEVKLSELNDKAWDRKLTLLSI